MISIRVIKNIYVCARANKHIIFKNSSVIIIVNYKIHISTDNMANNIDGIIYTMQISETHVKKIYIIKHSTIHEHCRY